MTLAGEGSRVHVLGTSIAFGRIREGRATIRVDDRSVTVVEGGTVSAAGLVLRCTTVTEDTVTMEGWLT